MRPTDDTTIKSLPTKVEEIALEISAALSSRTIYRTSIHDATGTSLWNSDGAIDEAEYSFVLDALDALALEPSRLCFERESGQGRGLVAFAARDPRGALHGALVVDAKLRSLGGRTGERLALPEFARLLHRLALRLAGSKPRGKVALPTAEHDGLAVTLYVQQLLKLKSTGRTRRYEVLLRADSAESSPTEAPKDLLARAEEPASGGKLDRVVLGELCGWLAANRAQLDVEPAAFTVNLSTGALLDESFIDFAEKALRAAHVNPRLLGFEIREQQCRQHFDAAQRFVRSCEKLGFQVVIDDFTFHSDVLPLLRQRAVRMLKIDASLTVAALKDKVAQAQVAAISHGSRVLGMHCVAKRIESPVARQWLSAIGVDFAQGFLLEGPLPITELASLRLTEPIRRV
ncbi:MAG TPA: EAL domain-containing protein [Steroidobacteraceae bacterium]|nr:EAL domain-containing protein [Steroidobacteraceae bacterium]